MALLDNLLLAQVIRKAFGKMCLIGLEYEDDQRGWVRGNRTASQLMKLSNIAQRCGVIYEKRSMAS